MAVTIKHSNDSVKPLLQHLGIDPGFADMLENESIKITTKIGGLFLVAAGDSTLLEAIEFKPGSLSLAAKGELGHFALSHIRSKIFDVVAKVIGKPSKDLVEAYTISPDTQVTVKASPLTAAKAFKQAGTEANEAAKAAKKAGKGTKSKSASVDPTMFAELNDTLASPDKIAEVMSKGAADLFSDTLTGGLENGLSKNEPGLSPLRLAGKLYEKVQGTSNGSVYVVAGIGEELALAVRYKNKRLSVRVEPVKGCEEFSPEHIKALTNAGLDQVSMLHFSVHFAAIQPDMARRVLGSILYGLFPLLGDVFPDWSLVINAS